MSVRRPQFARSLVRLTSSSSISPILSFFPSLLLSFLRSLFLLRFIKCPLNGPIVRPINPFLSTERTSLARPHCTVRRRRPRPRPSSRTRFATTRRFFPTRRRRRRRRRRRTPCCRKTVSSRKTLYCLRCFLLPFCALYGNRRHWRACVRLCSYKTQQLSRPFEQKLCGSKMPFFPCVASSVRKRHTRR